MKWINLADRKPIDVPYGKLFFRRVSDHMKIDAVIFEEDFIRDNTTNYLNAEVEWLDEEAYSVADHDPITIKYVVLSELYDDLKEKYEALKKQVTSIYELQALEVKRGNITIEEYLDICFPEKFYRKGGTYAIDELLAEQHRNTRHDAAEAVIGYIVDTDCFLDSSAIQSLIMNLKQRKP